MKGRSSIMTLNDMNTFESETCVHEPCQCTVENLTGTEGYCSETCRKAADDEEEMNCSCGHPACDSP